jgi:transcriptional regulator of acetoin/glycerol metabolism
MQNLQQHLRHVLNAGQEPQPACGTALDPSIARSWRRCLEQHHMDPSLPLSPAVHESARIRERREPLRQVLEIAEAEMRSLHRQLMGSGHAVLLSDADGVILERVTQDAERATFERAGLWAGADWSESCEGTNGIGTCLVERQLLSIHRDEHYRRCHSDLTCSASPVLAPDGELLAVLDLSMAGRQVTRQEQLQATALVSLSARLIESFYFLRRFEGAWVLRFQVQPGGFGVLNEGLLAFDEEGRVQALNDAALALLGQPRAPLLGQPMDALFDIHLDELFGRAVAQPASAWPLHTHDGRRLHGMLHGGVRRRQPGSPAAGNDGARKSALHLGDPGLRKSFQQACRVYERDVPLLLRGETGSGKEAFAKALHQASSRAGNAFVALNCAAIPETLIESELFGYRGGSFTGARKEGMRGKLQQADGGTLFLDEIGDMPLALQTRLLRVLEERQVVPIGGDPQAIDVRLISASHRDLRERVADGAFREDLLYRLDGLAIELPALRQRSDRGALLLQILREEARGEGMRLSAAARDALLAFAWPGNLRQMRNVLRTLVALNDNGLIELDDLPREIRQLGDHRGRQDGEARAPLAEAEDAALRASLQATHWNMTATARNLGISRNTLYRKLGKHGISRRDS